MKRHAPYGRGALGLNCALSLGSGRVDRGLAASTRHRTVAAPRALPAVVAGDGASQALGGDRYLERTVCRSPRNGNSLPGHYAARSGRVRPGAWPCSASRPPYQSPGGDQRGRDTAGPTSQRGRSTVTECAGRSRGGLVAPNQGRLSRLSASRSRRSGSVSPWESRPLSVPCRRGRKEVSPPTAEGAPDERDVCGIGQAEAGRVLD
jgi:hypothetical protein